MSTDHPNPQAVTMPIIEPGEYTKAELQKILGTSAKTIDRYRKRFNLPDKEGPSNAILIIIDQDAASSISEYVSGRLGQGHDIDEDSQIEGKDGDFASVPYLPKVRGLEAKIHELEKDKIRLEGRLLERDTLITSKDTVLASKQSEVDTLKSSLGHMQTTVKSLQASMMVLERDKQRLEEQTRLLEDKSNPPMTYAPVNENAEKPKGFWGKLKYAFGSE